MKIWAITPFEVYLQTARVLDAYCNRSGHMNEDLRTFRKEGEF